MSDRTPGTLPQKKFSRYKEPYIDFPNLVRSLHVEPYQEFLSKGLSDIVASLGEVVDYTGKKFKLKFGEVIFTPPTSDPDEVKRNLGTYKGEITIYTTLENIVTGRSVSQEIFFSDIPMITERGTFIINGVERVLVPQLRRVNGISFTVDKTNKGPVYGFAIRPENGDWIDVFVHTDGLVYVKINKRRKLPASIFFHAVFGITIDELINKISKENKEIIKALRDTQAKYPVESYEESCMEVYRRARGVDTPDKRSSVEYVKNMLSPERFTISDAGRVLFINKLGDDIGIEVSKDSTAVDLNDFIASLIYVDKIITGRGGFVDDIDHFGLKKVFTSGELLSQKVVQGMLQVIRGVRDRMASLDDTDFAPINVLNTRPFQARIKEFFSINPLSQIVDQYSPVSEAGKLRTVSMLGPGGLMRDTASVEARDIHHSHYGRVCVVHTPEGQNIGLILRLATYARLNKFGLIETPYVKVEKGKVTNEIVYLDAMAEERTTITHFMTAVKDGKLIPDPDGLVSVRRFGEPTKVSVDEVEYMDVGPYQIFSVVTSLIPFIENTAPNRVLMGSNMQRQAVPLLKPEAPLVATGMESVVAKNFGGVIFAEESGVVEYADAIRVVVKGKSGAKEYKLSSFKTTNSHTFFSHRVVVKKGDKVKAGDVIADTYSSDHGQSAIGKNIRVAFVPLKGWTYEDAIVVSERLVRDDEFTTVYVKTYECIVSDTKLGPETTTYDIPNVSEARLKNLDENGIIKIGSYVEEGDILVGKVTPRGDQDLTPEMRILKAIFGDKATNTKDTSLRVEHGRRGRVVDVRVFQRGDGRVSEPGVIKKIYVDVAELRPLKTGDKLCGRYGNKGIISKVLPPESMPFTKDGEPVDIVLTPLGVPSRMNLGQIFEMHLGQVAKELGYQAIVPPFEGMTIEELQEEFEKAGMSPDGKVELYDGDTGELISDKIAVGYMYILRLHHMIEDKYHARSIGPYSLVTQQPLGGKSQFGGQRFGEMEVWALEAHGASHVLREMLTIKSDDIVGRPKAFASIVKGDTEFDQFGTPASFDVLVAYLRALAFKVVVEKEKEGGKK